MNIKKYKINLTFFVFSIVLIAAFLFLEILFVSQNTEKTILENAVAKAEERSELMHDFFDKAGKELYALNDSKIFKRYLQADLPDTLTPLFKTFVDAHEMYMQLRYIDKDGYEKVRIDRDISGLATIIQGKDLQKKDKRSYFADSKDKTLNKVWFSALDLNMEHEKVQIPFTPTIRAVLPLEKEGKFNGILIANYRMEDFLNKLFKTSLYDMILLNQKGEILKHHKKELEWGRYRNQDYTIYDEFGPDTKAILSKDMHIGKHFLSKRLDVDVKDGLVLVFEIKHAYIDTLFQQQIKEYVTIAIVVFILSLIANIFVANIVKKINRDLSRTKILNRKLNELNTLLNDAQSIAKIGFWELNIDDGVIYWSDQIYHIFGVEDTTLKPTYEMFLSYVHPDDRDELNTRYQSSVEERKEYYIRHRVISASGELKYVEERAQHYYDGSGRHIKSVGSVYDRTEERLSQNKLKHYLKLLDDNIISSSTDLEGTITQVSQAFCEISEYTKEELIGQNHRIIKHPDTDPKLFKKMWASLSNNMVWQGELKNRTKNGGYYWAEATIYPDFDENGKKTGYTAIRSDITDKKILEELSITDAMTRLYNRRHFNDILPKIISSARRKNELLSFMIIDVDHFKQYNDTYGHLAGDNALISVARAIDNCLQRGDDYAFRLGGEEFGVIYRPDSDEKALDFAHKIKDAVQALAIRHEKNNASEYITVSIGLVTRHADEIKSNDALYKEADDCLYSAKKSGRNRVVSGRQPS